MKIFGTRIIREKTYRYLLKFKSEVEDILKKKLLVIPDKVLKNKNITASKGLVLVNSTISDSVIKCKGGVVIKTLGKTLVYNNIFKGKTKNG